MSKIQWQGVKLSILDRKNRKVNRANGRVTPSREHIKGHACDQDLGYSGTMYFSKSVGSPTPMVILVTVHLVFFLG